MATSAGRRRRLQNVFGAGAAVGGRGEVGSELVLAVDGVRSAAAPPVPAPVLDLAATRFRVGEAASPEPGACTLGGTVGSRGAALSSRRVGWAR